MYHQLSTNAWYSTYCEKKFIDGIGTRRFSVSQAVITRTREELLAKYLEACKKRTRWGHIKKREIIPYVEQAIALEQSGTRGIVSI